MSNIWKRMNGPDKASTRLLALTLAAVLVAALFMTVWGSPDVSTNTILSFESGDPAVTLTVDTGTEQPYLPDTLRAVVKLADVQIAAHPLPAGDGETPEYAGELSADVATPTGLPVEPEAQPAQPAFIQESPLDTCGYQAVGGGLYTYTNQAGAVSYRIYGSYGGSASAWFACDENGNVNGIIQDIPVSWSCTDYEKDIPGAYTFTASFPGHTYAGPRPFAMVVLEGESPVPAPEESPSTSEEPTPAPSPTVPSNSISGKLWLDENADGVIDETENGVAFYPVHLYTAGDTGAVVRSTQTEADGTYRFENLEPGSYVVGIAPETVAGVEYLLPVAGISHDNRFAINEEFTSAYSAPLEIAEDSAVENMHAGVRLAPGMTPFAGNTYAVGDFMALKKAVETDAVSGDTIVIKNDIPFIGFITIKNKSLTFKSNTSTPMVLTAKNSRHFKIEGETNNNIILTFDNVILDGGKLGGGIELAAGCSLQLVTPEIRNCLASGAAQNQAGAINIPASCIFTMTNGKIYGNVSTNGTGGGGGIYANSSTSVTLNGCDIYENTASANGGGIYVAGLFLELTLNNCMVETNQALNGGGIYSLMATIKVNGGEISGNRATGTQSNGNGGGIYLGHLATTGSLTLNSGKISGNTANGNGGGIYAASNVEIDMSQGTISGNTAASGGGIYTNSTTILTLDNCKVEDNTASSSPGGGIFVSGATVYVNGGTIARNTSVGSVGGGIYGISNATITINGGEISGNHAVGTSVAGTGNGGGIYVTGSKVEVKNGLIANNEATTPTTNTDYACGGGIAGLAGSTITISGGTFYNNTAKNKGGGIYAKQSSTLIEGGEIRYNNANEGAGVYSASFSLFKVTGGDIFENTATVNGGGIYSYANAETVISGGKIYKNYANTGGGIFVSGSGSGKVTISGGEISGNMTTGTGGGLYFSSISEVGISGNAKITGNEASSGGGIYSTGVTITIGGGKITHNKSTTQGGGIYASGTGTLTITGGEITDNEADSGGGGIYAPSFGGITVSGGKISANKGSAGGGIYFTGNNSKITVKDGGEISGNTAVGVGGGIYCLSVSEISVAGNAKITGNQASSGGGIYASGVSGKVTVSGGEISANNATNVSAVGGAGIYITSSSGTLEVSGGKIAGNINVNGSGGAGIYANNIAKLTVSGGEISGNKADSAYGGGIAACKITGGILISNGKITGNTAATAGGGIYLDTTNASAVLVINGGEISGNIGGFSGGGISANNDATITITGGKISGNIANSGGGIAVTGLRSTLTVRGGEITNNTSKGFGVGGGGGYGGGGIFISKLEDLTVNPTDSAAVIFSGNKAVQAYRMTDPAHISLHQSKIGTTVFSAMPTGEHFQYAYNNYDVNYTNGKLLCFVTFDSQGGSSVPAMSVEAGSLLTPPSPEPAPPAANPEYVFGGWYKEPSCTNAWNFTTDKVTGNITLYAKWLNVVNLTVSNTVTGPHASTTQAFTYTIHFFDAGGNPLQDGTEFAYTGGIVQGSGATAPENGVLTVGSAGSGSGKATFTLKHGQQITIAGITISNKVQVAQGAAGGYHTSIVDSEGTGSTPDGLSTGAQVLSADRTFAFKNASTIVPTGILTGSLEGPVLLVLPVLLLMGAGVGIHRKYRGRKESSL